jgi:phospho-N-acetylmuramoyl-pentapeptide-transferase
MIYHIFEYLREIGVDLPGSGLFQYLSFRAIAAFTTALLISIFAGKKIIGWLQKKQIGETIRDLGLEGQMQKKGTPTMGGIIIFLSIIIPVLLFANLANIYTGLLLISTVWFFLIGFTDDYIKVFKKNKEGMSEKAKLAAQGAMALSIGLAVCFSSDIVVRENPDHESNVSVVAAGEATLNPFTGNQTKLDVIKSTKTTIPFVKSHEFDYKLLSPFKGKFGWYTKWAIYVLMIVIVITACSNGVNLTDGMDGLAAGTTAIVGVVLGIFGWLGGNIVNAEYLNIMYIPGSGEVAVFMSALVGALIGFLWYNT